MNDSTTKISCWPFKPRISKKSKLIADKTQLINELTIEIINLKKQLENANKIIKDREYTIDRMTDILNQKRIEQKNELIIEAEEKQEKEKEKVQNRISGGFPKSSGYESHQNMTTIEEEEGVSKKSSRASETEITPLSPEIKPKFPPQPPQLQPEIKLRRQRQGISATPISDPKKLKLPKRNSKIYQNSESIEMIINSLSNNEFLGLQDYENIKLMAQCVHGPIRIAPDTKIINEGEAGDGLFILEAGTVEVGKNDKKIRIIQAGEEEKVGVVFGELAILYNCQRTASITAVSECKVWYLDRDSFQAITVESGQNKIKEIKEFLRNVSLFKGVGLNSVEKKCSSADWETFGKEARGLSLNQRVS